MNLFPNFRWRILLPALLLLAACNKNDAPTLRLGAGAILVDAPGSAGTLSFSASHVDRISVTAIPEGWTIVADLATMTLTATAPADGGTRSGTASVVGYGPGGSATEELFVGITEREDLSDRQSGCFIVSEPDREYRFDARVRGEGAGRIDTRDVRIIWQTGSDLIRYGRLDDGIYSFYVAGDGELVEGNVLLGAYDAAGTLLTTWHLWLVGTDDIGEQTYANGRTFMSLNLGALGNTNATGEEILGSFGLYYQWGRRTPFVGPDRFDAAGGRDASLYNDGGAHVYVEYLAAAGDAAYAETHPLQYLLGSSENNYDWHVAGRTEELWSGTAKSEYDPCPRGWRVPTADELAGLRIADLAADAAESYGWELTDGVMTSFYPAGGFRTYLTGLVQNLYSPVEGVDVPRPWMGCYWTSTLSGTEASALTFWYDAADPAASGIDGTAPRYRADGMLIRCVRDE